MTQRFREEYSRTKVKKLSQLVWGNRHKNKNNTHTDKKDMKRTYKLVWQFKTFLVAELKKETTNSRLFGWVISFCSLLDHDPDFFPQIPIFLLVRSRFFNSIEWQVWEWCASGFHCCYALRLSLLTDWASENFQAISQYSAVCCKERGNQQAERNTVRIFSLRAGWIQHCCFRHWPSALWISFRTKQHQFGRKGKVWVWWEILHWKPPLLSQPFLSLCESIPD